VKALGSKVKANFGLVSSQFALETFVASLLAMLSGQCGHEECLKCGFNGYVSKPFQEETLYQTVAKLFKTNAWLCLKTF